MKIYAISGLGADHRVFQKLSINADLHPLEWLEPKKHESIEAYAKRMSKKVKQDEDFGIIGVSFGGLVAIEMSKLLKPRITILISSVAQKSDLKWIYRLAGKLRLNQLLPLSFFTPPKKLAHWLFGAKDKALLNAILSDTDPQFAKWAIHQLLNWQNTDQLSTPLLMISGDQDKLMPANDKAFLIEGGEHFMVVDKGEEVSYRINERLKH